jgi:hypothetical protein
MNATIFERAVQPELMPVSVKTSVPSTVLRIWERRTLNSHRAVLYLDKQTPFHNAAEVQKTLRELVASQLNLRWIWLRGFSYGAFIHVPSLPDDVEALEKCVDIYGNNKGTLQWLIFVSDTPAIAFGIHTWAEVKLSTTYKSAIAAIERSGLPFHTFVRDKGAFFNFVTKLKQNPLPDFKG